MERLRPEDQKTLRLLMQKAKELDDEMEGDADIEEYRDFTNIFLREEQEKELKLLPIEDKDTHNVMQSENEIAEEKEIIDELQRELSADELFTPGDQQTKPDQKICIICSKSSAKYCCPGCSRKTCSLECSKKHKTQFSCNGKQNYTGFVSKQSYSEVNAKKDYQYLRRTLEGTEFIRKKLSFANHNPELLRLKLLKIYTRKKHKIDLSFAPTIMTRHRENISFYYMKTKIIFWLIEVHLLSFKSVEQESDAGHQQNNRVDIDMKELSGPKLIYPMKEVSGPKFIHSATEMKEVRGPKLIDSATEMKEVDGTKLIDSATEMKEVRGPKLIDSVTEMTEVRGPQLTDPATKMKEVSVRKLIDPIPENLLWKNVIGSEQANLFDEGLLLQYQIDFSADGISKQFEKNELNIFIQNRVNICDLLETYEKEKITSWSFTIPEEYKQLELPTEYREREVINKEFQQTYQMLQIHPNSQISNTLHAFKINEFPTIYLVNNKFLQPFQSKHTCLLLSSS